MKEIYVIGVVSFTIGIFAAPSIVHNHSGAHHNLLDRLKFSKSHGYSKQEISDGDKGILYCTACNTAISLFFNSMENNATEEQIVDGIVGICLNLNMYSEKVCRGVVTEAVPDFIHMFQNIRIDRENVCALFMIISRTGFVRFKVTYLKKYRKDPVADSRLHIHV
ncbi:uncharacterized protein LOC136042206 [Artemia franciscana]|uniref:uncharacterized protein LOC136042206 n=1 Tax=Artemia franciscana TaxID=6661 RepID=UPI0032DA0BEC